MQTWPFWWHHLWYGYQTGFSRSSRKDLYANNWLIQDFWLSRRLTVFFVCVCFISQVKNPTNAKCVVKRSAKAPIWSPTAGNTQASNRLDVTFVPRASSVKWICAGTTRASTAWSERAQEQQFKGIVWALWDGIVCCCGQGQQKKRFWATLT